MLLWNMCGCDVIAMESLPYIRCCEIIAVVQKLRHAIIAGDPEFLLGTHCDGLMAVNALLRDPRCATKRDHAGTHGAPRNAEGAPRKKTGGEIGLEIRNQNIA